MNIKFVEGDLLDSKTDVICHQVNCQGMFNSGVAKSVRIKYPKVYSEYLSLFKDNTLSHIGDIQMCNIYDNKYVCNLFGQEHFGYNHKRYTSYDAVYDGLSKLKKFMIDNKLISVSFPYRMSSVRGGANWEIIYCMICEIFKDTYINIEIWKLE